ncbi:MAG TPA: ribonuclease M5 [Sedimentibacter sp.]|jgi:ribonuclease M5|nr:ribonuclease M5 [Sedimentibacter sp.]HHZ01151.1 ribonuclease M5 [Tissierellia bacterium]HOK49005.1 ribonuclease M5 [Sedimentibacter sp.]HOW22464.1 ribonuclease M5 [Sedimentibacter sp.]HRC81368.1 ribonuclease M5 [Sedimentibacter sp.]
MDRISIKEIIVVEGKADVSAVKKAVDAQVISTNGLGINDQIISIIKKAAKNKGIIILTDPDYPGKKIRNILSSEIENCKHAFIPRDMASKDGDIGVENASKEAIIEALKNARAELANNVPEFTMDDMMHYGLLGNDKAALRRSLIGDILGIGYCSGKQFLKRLNSFGIGREELEEALLKANEDING